MMVPGGSGWLGWIAFGVCYAVAVAAGAVAGAAAAVWEGVTTFLSWLFSDEAE